MTYPNPPEQPSGYPAAPPPYGAAPQPSFGAPPPQGPLRGRTPRRLGWIFLALAIALFIAGGIVLATKSFSEVNKFQRVAVPTQNSTVTFNRTGKWVAYYEASNVHSGIDSVPAVRVAIESPSGQVRELTTLYGNRSDRKVKIFTYDYNNHRGVALYQFNISETGTYHVATQPGPAAAADAKIAFGKDISGGTIAGGLIVVGGVVALIVAIVLLIVGYVKRSRHKRELQSGQFGGPPPGYGPPAGYGTPPGYAPPPPGYSGSSPSAPGYPSQQPPPYNAPPSDPPPYNPPPA